MICGHMLQRSFFSSRPTHHTSQTQAGTTITRAAMTISADLILSNALAGLQGRRPAR